MDHHWRCCVRSCEDEALHAPGSRPLPPTDSGWPSRSTKPEQRAMDATTAAGLDPSVVAREIIDGVLARKHESVLADLKSRIAILLRALLPNVLCGVMAKRYLKERDKAAGMPPASRS